MSSLFKWGHKRQDEPAPAVPAASDGATVSKVLPKFLSALTPVTAPVLMDLGPVVGQNISFFGDQLSCKIVVEDFFAERETLARRGSLQGFDEVVSRRLQQPAGTINGILCWDLFDYLDKATSQLLAARLVSLLAPGGVVYGFFGSTQGEVRHYTRFLVEGRDRLRLKPYEATPTKRNVLVTRDISRMFDGLQMSDSVLLKTNSREILFRKP